MALTKCKDCGHEISNKADSCPNCGAPKEPKQYGCGTLIVVIFVVGLLVSLINNIDKTSSTRPLSQPIKTPQKNKDDYIATLSRQIDELNKYKIERYTNSKDSIITAISIFSAWVMIAEEGKKFTFNDEEKLLLKNFKDKLSFVQSRAFPKLRDAYGPALRKVLWEHDITAKTFGSGYRTIQFVGGIFAANRNIADFQEKISNILQQLRFNEARYKWFKEEDEYTYYDIKSPGDRKLIIWNEGGSYREVK